MNSRKRSSRNRPDMSVVGKAQTRGHRRWGMRSMRACARALAFGTLLQASGCTFDSEAFLGDTLTAIFNNAAATFIITGLSDLLGVTPSFGF